MQGIYSKENKKIKYAIGLKKKIFRRQEASFLIEGKLMMEEALKHPEILRQIFIEEELVPEYTELYRKHPEWEYYVLDKRLMKHISDTETPPGILAVCHIPSRTWEELLAKNAFLLYLDRLADPGNMGTIIRSAWAFGVDGILFSPETVDPYSPKVVRASMGGIFNLPLFPDFTYEGLEYLKQKGYSLFCASLRAEREVFSLDFTGSSVLVIGSESQGVAPFIEDICDNRCKIPLKPGVDSLNAAVACAIILCEAWKQRRGFVLS